MILNLTSRYPKVDDFFSDGKVFCRQPSPAELATLKRYLNDVQPDEPFPTREFRYVELIASMLGPSGSSTKSGDAAVMGDDILAIDFLIEMVAAGKSHVAKLIVSVPKKERFGGASFRRA